MAGSGAQLNRWGNNGGVVLLSLTTSASAVSTPLTGYGTIGQGPNGGVPTQNDSGVICSMIGFSKLSFQLVGTGTGYTVTLYGSLDPALYIAFTANSGNDFFGTPITGTMPPYINQSLAAPASSWVPIPGPSEQTGTGAIANPMTSSTPLMYTSMPWVAIRAVLTGATNLSGTVKVVAFAVP